MKAVENLRSTRSGRWIFGIAVFATALGFVAVGALAFIKAQGIISPVVEPLSWAAVAFTVLTDLITLLATRFTKDGQGHPVVLGALVASIVGIVVVFGLIWRTQGEADLMPGREVRGELEAGGSAVHRFRTQPGDAVVIRVLPQGRLEVTALAAGGTQRIPISGPPEGRDLELSKVMVGGLWTLQLNSVGDSAGRYRVQYDVIERARSMQVGSELAFERIGRAGAENGYLIEPVDEGVTIAVEPRTGDLPLGITLHRDLRVEVENPPPGSDGRYVMEIRLRSGSTYVLVVRGQGASGAFRIEVRSGSPDEPPATASTPPEGVAVAVPPVYGLTEELAYESLTASGLVGESIRVCSSSVAEGNVRQAFVVDPDGAELIVDDEPGVPVALSSVDPNQTVYLKISTGSPCG